MALEPTKHVNGRMWPPGVSGNPNGRPVGSRTAFSAGFLRDLAHRRVCTRPLRAGSIGCGVPGATVRTVVSVPADCGGGAYRPPIGT